jgi:hypothetical protein
MISKKPTQFRRLILSGVILFVCLFGVYRVGATVARKIFLPIVYPGGGYNYGGYPPPGPPYPVDATATPITPDPSPTPELHPGSLNLPFILNNFTSDRIINQVIHFRGAFGNIPFEGRVTSIARVTSLTPAYGPSVYPQGVFVAVLMDVTNTGQESDEIGRYNSFKIADTENRKFDLASIDAHLAAEDQYERGSVYTTVQPGFTIPLVFVFDVLPASQGFQLVSLSAW